MATDDTLVPAADCGCDEYHALSRREFVQDLGIAFSAITLPAWLPKVVMAQSEDTSRDVIVSIYLRGGADGLTMCVPFGDPAYYTSRPTLAIPRPDSNQTATRAIALDDFFGLPRGLAALEQPFRQGHLLICHATGQLNTSRSHFDAQRFMEVGKAGDPSIVSGWLGRHLATKAPMRATATLRGIGIASGLQRTLVGAPKTLPIPDPANYSIAGSAATREARLAFLREDYTLDADPLKAAALDTNTTIDTLRRIDFANYRPANGASYPNTGFGRAMRATAAMIKADIGLEAAQVDIGGWDTHANQNPLTGTMHQRMLELGNTLGAFWQDVLQGPQTHRVTVVAVTEFGRNVRENGSLGTDHGRATVLFAMGRNIAGGRVYTRSWPGLARENLEAGQDLRVTLDHRDVLAEIVQNRLNNGANLSLIFPDYQPVMRGVTR